MSWAWLIGGREIATIIKNATQLPSYQLKDHGAIRECPNCHHLIDNSDVSFEWPGLPAGVKFDPSDAELLKHLSGKIELGNSEPHLFIEDFIPTLEGEDGICYTHPENLPGSKRNGNNVFFFHKTTSAYATGPRKRRKVLRQHNSSEDLRWHKTGKTKAVMENGHHKGWKKIMVLYRSTNKGSKADKSNWVMHQYHLGANEDEGEVEFVVSKLFYQTNGVIEEPVTVEFQASSSTPLQHTSHRSFQGNYCPLLDEENIYYISSAKDAELFSEAPELHPEAVVLEDEKWESGVDQVSNFSHFKNRSDMLGGDFDATCGITEFDNLNLDTSPDFLLSDAQFGYLEMENILEAKIVSDIFDVAHVSDVVILIGFSIRTWLIDSKTIAAKVKNATQPPSNQVKDCGANRQCPNCFHRIDNSDIVYQKGTEDDMSYRVFLNWRLLKASFVVPCLVQVAVEWPGLPAGVKFDPSDVELIKHLSGKAGLGNSEPHLFINEFIPTLEGEDGICYTHPENLPGSKRDGNSVHFFHRTSRAYATGPRKRRRIHGQCNSSEEHVRWHKTGKTKAMMENGIQRGWKKIMVLYKSSKKGYKPDKSNWVMHQYHLGAKEDEEEGEFVVSKIFFQQQAKQFGKDDIDHLVIEEPVTTGVRASPSTPLQHTANHSRQGKRVLLDEVDEENVYYSPAQDTELTLEAPESNQEDVSLEDLRGLPLWWEGKAQAVEESYNVNSSLCNENFNSYTPAKNVDVSLLCNENLDSNARADDMDASLLCNENLDPYAPIDESGLQHVPYFFDFDESRSGMPGGDINTTYGISDLNNLEMGAPPFSLLDLQFGSQESLGWLDRL
ncbi:hypothetical protein GIB67_004424 [Kingdonia uniflora]|uniref:NAC domain-containing protein n=1 Tax=Kingdonia uniflora TaxID=39325 RepID=A0A7J7MRH7_9MAGN|nr:hypothetical protein GIB67_004424 [Kingdonia uniflora]